MPTETPTVHITAENFDTAITVSFEEIVAKTEKAQQQWEEYRKTGEIILLKAIVSDDSFYPVIAIGETLKYFAMKPSQGFQLHIDSQIPIGSGHGSSAAVAASIAGAVAAFLGKPTDTKTISTIAIRIEQKKHGNPSYGDVGAVISGGLIWFQKKSPEEIVIKPLDFTMPESLSRNLLVMQTGIPKESTGEMVHSVALFKEQHPELFKNILEEQATLTYELRDAIKSGDEERLPAIIRAGEKNLETIGVVSHSAQVLIREIEKAGGAAKICGAGGKEEHSGVILAYHPERRTLETIAKTRKIVYYTVQLGAKGLIVA